MQNICRQAGHKQIEEGAGEKSKMKLGAARSSSFLYIRKGYNSD